MKKLMIALAFAGMGAVAANAQTQIETPSKYTVATNSFWSNWYVQVGVDMSLQNPYGSNFGDDVSPTVSLLVSTLLSASGLLRVLVFALRFSGRTVFLRTSTQTGSAT
jgi:hypothetical protein